MGRVLFMSVSVAWVIAAGACGLFKRDGAQQTTIASVSQSKLDAFRNTLQPFLIQHCGSCHGDGGNRPSLFAVTDAASGYIQAKNYVNFDSVPSSTLALRANDGHCGNANYCSGFGPDVIRAIQQWRDSE